jgi:ATP-dependent DNA helicase RecQ
MVVYHISGNFPETQLRLVIATVAFGMGIDCPHVRQIIHVGPPDNLEAYIQESGRAGRDGSNSLAVLFLIKGMLGKYVNADMKNYITNSSLCRRNLLFNNFEGYFTADFPTRCACCDICAENCSCGRCDHESFFLF